MALPWETPSTLATLPPGPRKPRLPWDPEEHLLDPNAATPNVAGADEEPDEPGFFTKWLLEPLGRPGSALKSALSGELGKAARTLVPFGETLGVYNPKEDYTSGQHLLHKWGLTDTEDAPLLSGQGAAGLAADFALDPLNLLGIGAATKAGKALALTRGGLKEGATVAKALRRGADLEELGAAGRAVDLASPVAQAGRRAAAAARQAGSTLENFLIPAENVGEAAARGEKALLTVGEHYDPFGLLRLGGKYNPVNLLPEIPGLTAPLELPESIAGTPLVRGEGVLRGVSQGVEKLGQTAPFRQIGQLFSKAPGMEGQAAENFIEATESAAKARSAAETAAAEEASLLQQRLKDPELLRPKPVQAGPDLVDARTGEVLEEGTEGLDELLGFTPEKDAYSKMLGPRYEPKAPEPFSLAARTRPLEDVALKAEIVPGMKVTTPKGVGRVVKIENGTATVSYGSIREDVPLGELTQRTTVREEQERNLLRELGPEGKKALDERSADTRKILGQGNQALESVAREKYNLQSGEKGLSKAANIDLQGMIDSEVGKLGYSGGREGQARALARTIEQDLNITGSLPPGLKSVETFSADAAELMPGDSFPIAGEKFTLKGTTPEGKLRLKDHIEIEVPPEAVPKDKGAEIVKSTLPAPFSPSEAPATTGKGTGMSQGEIERILGSAENRELPPEVQAHLEALKAERIEAGTPKSTLPPFMEPAAAAGPTPPKLPADFAAGVAAEGTKAAELDASAKAMGLGSRHELYNKLRQAKQNLENAQEALATYPIEAGNTIEYQNAGRAQKHWAEEYHYFRNWIEQGKPPLLGPHPTVAATQRETARRIITPNISAQARIGEYLQKAGYGTAEAARESAKLLPKDASAEVGKVITDALELGDVPASGAGEVAGSLRKTYDDMFKAEQDFVVQTPGLKDPRLTGYAPHIGTQSAKGFFTGLAKAPKKREAVFRALQEAREAKGITNLAEGGMAEGVKEGAEYISKHSEGAKQIAIPNYMKGEAEARLASLDQPTRQWLEEKGLEREFLTWDKLASNTHESQIARLAQYKGLSVNELNDVFKRQGAKSDVFSADPAVQLFVRSKRHAAAKAANTLFEQLADLSGRELPAGTPVRYYPTDAPGVFRYVDKAGQDLGYGVAEYNERLSGIGKAPIIFPDQPTAAGLQKSITKMLNPEEAAPLMKWYDQATQVFKAWETKGFPAFHVRNHISNRLQSFLEDVPVSGEHYTKANQFLAGRDFTLPLGDGSTATRDALKAEMVNQGVLNRGFFESEFGNAVEGQLRKESTWNLLDPNNKILKGAERVGSGLAMLPGQIASGAGAGAALRADGHALESLDRVGHYLAKRMQGFSPADAAASVKTALFDYSDLNDFEKNILGRAVFFYGYQRNILPLALNKMLTKPGAVHQMMELSAGGQGPDQQGLPAHLPAFARENLPSSLGRDAQGNPEVLWGVENPITAALQPVAGFSEGPQRGAEKLLASLNPLIRTPLELATNRRFFLGKDIDEANRAPHYVEDLPEFMQRGLGVQKATTKSGDTRYTMDPYALFALESSPLGRVSGTGSKLADERKSTLDQLTNLLTGAHVSSIDEEKEAYYAKKAKTMAELKALERKGLVEERQLPIFTATDAGKEDPAVKAALKANRPAKKKAAK